MGRFFVRFRVETLASIAERIVQQRPGERPVWKFSWKTDDVRLVLYDVVCNESGVPVPEGLGLDLDVPGENLDEAIGKAQNIAEGLVNLISFATASACKAATLISVHEIPKGRADVDVAWFHQRTHRPLGDLRSIDADLLSSVYTMYDEADEDTKWRVSQAVQWLRKGSLELETVGQFVAYWEGLEAASWRLLDILCSSELELFPTCSECKHQIEVCPECGHGLGHRNDMAGVAELFGQFISGGKQTYSRIRSHRAQLFHGGKKLKPEFLESLRENIPLLRVALSVAIGVCLGLEEDEIKRIADTQLRRALRPVILKVFGKLIAFQAPPLDKPDSQPFVEHEPKRKYSVTPDGKLSVTFAHTVTMRNASFQATEYEMWGDEHARAKEV
ncbi:hypothetical protein KAX17_12550 [Candidatus Bipolaricaulota bacterium]|nr:hypothetical protein [Candidatus Bipolaricaulota bacterium]